MGFKVVNVFRLPEVDFGDELLHPLSATLVNGMWMKEEEIIAHSRDADAVIGVVSIQPFNRRLMSALPRCRVIAGIGIGYDKTDLEAARELGIAVTNVPTTVWTRSLDLPWDTCSPWGTGCSRSTGQSENGGWSLRWTKRR